MLSLKHKNVLVSGGAGFIGSHLAERLVAEEPAHVVIVDNLSLGKESNLDGARRADRGLVFHREDTSDYEAIREILVREDVDVVFDLATIPLPRSLVDPRRSVEDNVLGTTVMCETLREGLYSTLVHYSTSEVYGNAEYVPMDERHPLVPRTPYAASKASGDHIVLSYRETFGVDAVILRPFNGFGPRQNAAAYAGVIPIVVQRALRSEPVHVFGDGEQTRDFTFVSDIVEATLLTYQHPETRGRVINVASGVELSVNSLVSQLIAIVGNDVEVVHNEPRPGDVRRHCGSPALLEELTGYRAKRPLSDGLEETVEWYRESLADDAISR